jgi:hypothetical protein
VVDQVISLLRKLDVAAPLT